MQGLWNKIGALIASCPGLRFGWVPSHGKKEHWEAPDGQDSHLWRSLNDAADREASAARDARWESEIGMRNGWAWEERRAEAALRRVFKGSEALREDYPEVHTQSRSQRTGSSSGSDSESGREEGRGIIEISESEEDILENSGESVSGEGERGTPSQPQKRNLSQPGALSARGEEGHNIHVEPSVDTSSRSHKKARTKGPAHCPSPGGGGPDASVPADRGRKRKIREAVDNSGGGGTSKAARIKENPRRKGA